MQGWQLLSAGELFPGITVGDFAQRRKALRSYLPTESMVILESAPVKQMTEAVPYPYRQDADYLYFTGCQQPEGLAVLDDHSDLCMFMPDRDPEVLYRTSYLRFLGSPSIVPAFMSFLLSLSIHVKHFLFNSRKHLSTCLSTCL